MHSFAAMTTRCELLLHGVSATQGAQLAARIEARVAALVRRYNFHASDSWLTRVVNQRQAGRVRIDAETAAILRIVREHSARCNGVFDITTGTCVARLRQARSAREALQIRRQLAPYIGLAHWMLEADDVLLFDNPLTRLDLGGVIKEYAVDESARMAREAGVASGIVNYGGDLACWGTKPDGQRFVAAIPNPQAPERMLFGLDLHDQALTTSGHYSRQRTVKGGALSHIVGTPDSPWLSCSVVSRSALLSGIYSTALLLRGDLSLPSDTLALVVDAQGQVHTLDSASSPVSATTAAAPLAGKCG